MFLTIENDQLFPPPNTWQVLTFLNPLDALIPTPFLFFAEFRVRATSGAQGSVSVGFGGPLQLSLLGGASSHGALLNPPPSDEILILIILSLMQRADTGSRGEQLDRPRNEAPPNIGRSDRRR